MGEIGTGYQLFGIGKSTQGLSHRLLRGEAVVIGRHPECTIVVTPDPARVEQAGQLSRRHTVLEQDASGRWYAYDAGSLNGTSVLRKGLPPATAIGTGERLFLEEGDVLELAGLPAFQFVYRRDSQAVHLTPVDGINPTQLVFATAHPSVQRVIDGQAADLFNLDRGPLRLAGGDDWVGWQATGTAAVVAEIERRDRGASLRVARAGVLLNLEEVAVEKATALKDRDLITFAGAESSAFLFLDPREIPVRPLSDLLMGADRVSIGSAPDNLCRLVEPSISRHHAVIWREGGDLFVRDLDSSNGTYVNDRRVFASERLTPQCRVSLGRQPFVADESCWNGGATGTRGLGVDVRFIGVSVRIAGRLRLRDVSMGVARGEMIGLLGPSASGKSTLLKTLAGQYRVAAGDVYVNGRAMSRDAGRWSWLASMMGFRGETYEVGFVQQHDLVQPELTVREILAYAGRHMGLAAAEAEARADRTGKLCNLGPLMNRVAQQANGQLNLSGGQLKRVCVAIEVLREPRILVLDEPTTGQDPKNTDDLMQLFRSLAQQGVTLLMSTHDLRNLALFDKVCVLCLGHLVYYGPPDGFAAHFDAATAELVYGSLPDREDRSSEAESLARTFRATPLYRQYCEAPA
jgi:ABC-type multidrug transport system ATPase subunit/pSer/pThr/pTyr-binding forkhead associated (FHA) protein